MLKAIKEGFITGYQSTVKGSAAIISMPSSINTVREQTDGLLERSVVTDFNTKLTLAKVKTLGSKVDSLDATLEEVLSKLDYLCKK